MSEPSKHPDRITAIASGLVAAFALAVSTYNVVLQRQQVRAQVWPRLEAWTNNVPTFAFVLHNSGVGPAEVKSVSVTVDGKAMRDWDEAILQLEGRSLPHFHSFMSGRVFGPGAEAEPLSVHDAVSSEAIEGQWKRIQIDVCYCSVLGECWMVSLGNRTVPMAKCIQPATPFLQ